MTWVDIAFTVFLKFLTLSVLISNEESKEKSDLTSSSCRASSDAMSSIDVMSSNDKIGGTLLVLTLPGPG